MNLVKKFVVFAGGRLFGAALQGITFVILAREMGPTGFGILSVFLGVALVVQAVFDLGISTLIVRARAEGDNNVVLKALGLYGLMGIAMLVALQALVFFLVSQHGLLGLLLLPLGIVFERQSDVYLGVTLSDGDVWINSTVLLGRRLAILIIFVLLINTEIEVDQAFSISMLLATLASYAVARVVVGRRTLGEPDSSVSKRSILRSAVPFWLNTAGAQLRNLDSYIVAAVSGPIAAGLYGAIARMTGPLRLVATSMSSIVMPMVARSGARFVLIPISVLLLVLVLVYGLVAWLSPGLVSILLGPEYEGAAAPLRILASALIVAATVSLANSVLQGVGQQSYVGRMTLLTSGLALLLIGYGAAHSGVIGAVYGLAISYVINLCLLLPRVWPLIVMKGESDVTK